MNEQLKCPDCKGTGDSGVRPSPLGMRKLTVKQAEELFKLFAKCRFCDGTGKTTAERLEWKATGEAWKAARRARGFGLRGWAEHCGGLHSGYADMEAGRVKPDPRFSPIEVQS